MRILRAAEVAPDPNAAAYAHSRGRALIAVAFVFALAAVIAVGGYQQHQPKLGAGIAAFILLVMSLMRGFVSARFGPDNWLVIADDRGLYIKFRSYLNARLPVDDPTVVFLPYTEIRSARLVFAKSETPDVQGGTQTQTRRLIELELSGDATPLRDALSAELNRKAPQEKRWFGSSSTLYGDYPVQFVDPAGLDIQWSVVPGARVLLDTLRMRTSIEPDVHVDEDFAHLRSLDPAERDRRIRALAERGQIIAAVHVVRRLTGSSLADAMDYVRGLKAGAH